MRPAYRFALVGAAALLTLAGLWAWRATVADGAAAPPEISAAATEALEARATPPSAQAGPAPVPAGAGATPPTRAEVLDAIQQAEEAELGAAEAEQRRRVREQMLEARAKHLH